jgi:type II secretory pathway predicted ATPase ExeA
MYKSYFNLKSAPFRLTPDTHCFFSEGNRKAILDALLYAVNNGDGIIKVVGEVGSGKTLLSRLLEQSLPPSFEILYLLNPRIPPDKILYAIALELGLGNDSALDKVSLLHLLHNKLLQHHQQGRQTVLLIDEAQAIPIESLEEIRMLSNLETGSHKLLQCVLFGQPELDQNLNRHEVRQIRERIIHSFYLPRLRREEVVRYLDFRLQYAGYKGAFPFSGLAVKIITWETEGFLRRINILAEKCLLAAFAKQSRKVSGFTALQVALEGRPWKPGIAVIMLGAVLVLGMAVTLTLPRGNAIVIEPPAGNRAQYPPAAAVSSDADDYSIQLLNLTADNRQQLHRRLLKRIPGNLRDRVFAHATRANAYQVFLGGFGTQQAAEKLLQSLPEPLRNNKPFVVKQSAITRQYNDLAITLKAEPEALNTREKSP